MTYYYGIEPAERNFVEDRFACLSGCHFNNQDELAKALGASDGLGDSGRKGMTSVLATHIWPQTFY